MRMRIRITTTAVSTYEQKIVRDAGVTRLTIVLAARKKVNTLLGLFLLLFFSPFSLCFLSFFSFVVVVVLVFFVACTSAGGVSWTDRRHTRLGFVVFFF